VIQKVPPNINAITAAWRTKSVAELKLQLQPMKRREFRWWVSLKRVFPAETWAYQSGPLNVRSARGGPASPAETAGVVPVTRVPAILSEWRTPRHREFSQDGKTVWRLFNAFTEALKGSSPHGVLPRRSQALHGLMDVACGSAA
jgi:hypothetical protein